MPQKIWDHKGEVLEALGFDLSAVNNFFSRSKPDAAELAAMKWRRLFNSFYSIYRQFPILEATSQAILDTYMQYPRVENLEEGRRRNEAMKTRKKDAASERQGNARTQSWVHHQTS